MGLDMYAYVAKDEKQQQEYWDSYNYETDSSSVSKPKELAYWRKHPNLHGWFRQEWESQGNSGSFNGDQLEVTWEMLDRLETDIKEGQLPTTSGFFFGDPSDEYYREQDLEFIKNARAELFLGLRVFYNSSW